MFRAHHHYYCYLNVQNQNWMGTEKREREQTELHQIVLSTYNIRSMVLIWQVIGLGIEMRVCVYLCTFLRISKQRYLPLLTYNHHTQHTHEHNYNRINLEQHTHFGNIVITRLQIFIRTIYYTSGNDLYVILKKMTGVKFHAHLHARNEHTFKTFLWQCGKKTI